MQKPDASGQPPKVPAGGGLGSLPDGGASISNDESSGQRPPEPLTDAVRTRMEQQQRRDTTPELALRRELHSRGLRYRVDAPLPMIRRRRADLLFVGPRVAVFVDGCFWHACPDHANEPTNNRAWWRRKLNGNVARDRDTDQRLQEADWEPVRVWEHAVQENVAAAANEVEAVVRGRAQ